MNWRPTDPGLRHLAHLLLALVLLVVTGLLVGCATPAQQLQLVKVPTPVECREQIPDRPIMPTDALPQSHSLDAKVAAALAEIETREGYEGRLRAALVACTRPIGPIEGGRRGQ